MPKKRILVLTDHMPWGHRSIAKAIYEYLKEVESENNWQVEYAQVKAETGIVGDSYVFLYRYFPKAVIIGHKIMENEVVRKIVMEASENNLKNLKDVVEKSKPDLIISCYFFHSHSLARWRKKKNLRFKLWTVAADPWTINQAAFVEAADLHLVYDSVVRNLAIKYGINEDNILETGWWVRPEMYKKYNRQEARKKMGFADDRPVVFVGGGSLGNSALMKILPVLMLVKKKIGLVFNSGTDRLGYNLVEEYGRLFKRLKKDSVVKIVNTGWIDNMAQVLAGCDIVLGKAGPNFLFDVVACGKPFVAVTHISGQEDGNLKIIKKKSLGWVKEKNGELSKFLLDYSVDSQKYNSSFAGEIKAEADRNKKCRAIIVKRVKEELG